MTDMRRVFELARRDFLTRARSRAFLVSMIIIVGLVFAAGPLLALTINEDRPQARVGVVAGAPDGFTQMLTGQSSAVDIDISHQTFADAAAGEVALDAGDINALVNGTELVWKGEPWGTLDAAIRAALHLTVRQQVVDELGLSDTEIGRLFTPVNVTERRLTVPDPEDAPRQAAAFVGMMLLYISILMFGQFVLMGVMEEKQNRVVEVVLSRVSPAQVLTGKIVGIGALGLIQLIVLSAAILTTVNVVDLADVDLGAIGLEVLISVLGWYLLGYAFYSVMYGGLGATVSRQEDMQGVVMLPVIFILPGFFIAQLAATDPDLTLVRIASFIPAWSPMVMSIRSAVTDVPLWELALSIALIIVSTVLLIRVAARIYVGAVLRFGRKVKLREAWRSAET